MIQLLLKAVPKIYLMPENSYHFNAAETAHRFGHPLKTVPGLGPRSQGKMGSLEKPDLKD